MILSPLNKKVIYKLVCIFLLTFVLYAQTINDPFHFDDAVTIVTNKSVHYLPDWPLTIREILNFQPSRFVTNLTFALNFYVHKLHTFGYHVINILIHIINVLLVWGLGEWLLLFHKTSSPGEKHNTLVKRHAVHKKRSEVVKPLAGLIDQVPFLAALIFLAHPVNTQAVSYISQRSESLAAMFYVAAVLFYLRGRTVNENGPVYFAGALISGLLASFSKETAISLPLMIVFLEFYFFKKADQGHGRFISTGWLIFFLAAFFLTLVPSAFHFQFAQRLFTPYFSQSHLGDVLTPLTYLLTQLKVFVVFFRLVFLPVGLNLDYDFSMVHSLIEPGACFSLIFLAGLIGCAIKMRRKAPLLALAVFWFFLGLSSNLVPRAHVMFEHKLYLVLMGFLPALCLGLAFYFKNVRAVIIGILIGVIIFSGMTIVRNRVWSSEVSLWSDVLSKSPHKARAYLSMGTAIAQNKDYASAVKYFTQAMGMLADPYLPYLNRGSVYVNMKRDDLALNDFNEAIRINPHGLNALINRGEIFARRKDYDSAIKDFEKTLQIDPQFAPGYKMRGRIYDASQQYPQALADYEHALKIEPADAQLYAWRGYILAIRGEFDLALHDFNAAIRLDPGFSDAYVYRGMYHKDRGHRSDALRDFNKAVQLKPDSALAYYQRAQLNFSSGDFKEALKDVEKAVTCDPQFDLPYALRAVLYAQAKSYDLAIDDFNQAIELNPQSLEAYMNRGSLYLMMNNYAKALDDFTRVIQLNPSSYQAFSKRAGAYGHLGQYDLAIADFSRAMALNPQQGAEYYNRSQIYKESRQRQKALADALKARQLGFPVNDAYLDELR